MKAKIPFENLLDQDESTLVKILQDNELVNDLVSFLIEMPKEDQGENRCFKYPFIAAEIFSYDIAQLVDKFFVPEKEKTPAQSEFDISPIDVDNMELGFSEKCYLSMKPQSIPKSLFLEEQKEPKNIEEGELEIETLEQKQCEEEASLARAMNERDRIEIEYDSDSKFELKLKEEEISFEMAKKKPKTYPLFDRLLSLLKENAPLNPVIAGYFCRVLSSIFERRPIDALQYLFVNSEPIKNLLNHCYNTSIAEFLHRVITNESEGTFCFSEKIKLLEAIVNRMTSTLNMEELENCSWIISLVKNRHMIKHLLNIDTLRVIYNVALSEAGSVHGLSILINLLHPRVSANTDTESEVNLGFELDSIEEVIPKPEEEYDLTALISLISKNKRKMGQISKYR